MNNFLFLKKYQALQHQIMFDEIIDLEFASIGYSKGDKSSYWNYALIGKNIGSNELSKIENEMNKIKRTPVVYFENNDNVVPTIKLLEEQKYKKDYEDSWMFYSGDPIELNKKYNTKKVENEEELRIFLNTLDSCYKKHDPQNPYGELGDYLGVAEKVWKTHNRTNRLEYFVVYKDDKPVAVATLTNHDDIGYISNVGSLREVRGEGFGKFATLYCIEVSKKNGNKVHCLATEEGTYPNEFYKRIGFETKFTAVAYKKI